MWALRGTRLTWRNAVAAIGAREWHTFTASPHVWERPLGLWAAVLTHLERAKKGGGDHRTAVVSPWCGVLGFLIQPLPRFLKGTKQSILWASAGADGALPGARHAPNALYLRRDGYSLQSSPTETVFYTMFGSGLWLHHLLADEKPAVSHAYVTWGRKSTRPHP